MNAILEQINTIGKSFVEFALPMLAQFSILFLILLFIDFLLRRKVRSVFRYWIWMLVLAKLVLPTSLSSPLSLGYLFGDSLTSLHVTPVVPKSAQQPPVISPQTIDFSNVPPAVDTSPVVTSPKTLPSPTQSVSPPSPPPTTLSWQGVVFLLWLAVVIAMALLLLQRAIFVKGLVAQAGEADISIKDTFNSCLERIEVTRRIGLKVSTNATSPAVCGLFRPVILLPNNLSTSLSAGQLQSVLLHELAHIKRGDLWVNLVQTVLQILYFYNPLLWIANAIIRRIREQAVDEMVLVVMGEKAQQYPQTLVSVAKLAFKRPVLSLRLIGVVESKSALSGRIKRILTRPVPRTSKLGILGLIAIIITAVILLPMAKAQKQVGQMTDVQVEGEKAKSELEGKLIQGFRENRDKFECGVLAWSGKSVNYSYSDSNDPRRELAGQHELWWDGKKIATKYVQDQVYTDPTGRFWVDKQQGGNSYDGSLLSRKPRFNYHENWFGPTITRWRGQGSRDWLILEGNKRENIRKEWSVVDTNGVKLIRLMTKNMNETDTDYRAYSIEYYDPSKGYGLVNEEWYNSDGSRRMKHTVKLQEVIPGGWFPVEVDFKSFAITDGRVYQHQHYELDIERCSFNDRAAIPEGIFKGAIEKQLKEQEKLEKILEGFSDIKEIDEADRVKWGARESVVSFVGRVLEADFEKAKEYAHPDRLPADHIKDVYEQAKGQNLRIMAVFADDWSALAVGSVILGDHGRVGPLVLHMVKVISDGKENWSIHDIDMITAEETRKVLGKFLKEHLDAVMIAGQKTDVRVDVLRLGAVKGEQERPANGIRAVPAITKTGKSIIQIDLMTGEVVSGRQMDWETAVELKNILGDKVALDDPAPPSKKSALDAGALLRKAVAATDVVEGTSGRNKRVTKEELKAVVDTLASRGYLKILTNPTLQVVSGKTAKVKSAKASSTSTTEDSFEVTARVLDDGYIELQTRVVLDEKSTPADQDSLLLVTKRELSGTFRIGSGASCIAGGIEKSVKRPVVGDNPETLEYRTTEELVVLTATVIDAPSSPQPRADVQVEGESQEDLNKKIEELIGILKDFEVGDREKWFSAVKELIAIGSPAVKPLSIEIRTAERPQTQSVIAFTLRAIGDSNAIPALIDALERSGFSSDYGVGKADTELSRFIRRYQVNPSADGVRLCRPVREITIALERLTDHTEGHEHFITIGDVVITPELRDRQRAQYREVAQRWRQWWQQQKKAKESGVLAAAASEGSLLEFHIVPDTSQGEWLGLTPEDISKYKGSLSTEGPFAGSIRGEAYQWYSIKEDLRIQHGFIVQKYKGKKYLLLCARQKHSIWPPIGTDRSWGLQKVYAIKDSNGRPAIGFEFDKRGGELFYALTKGNIGKTLAVIIDGEVVSTPMIMSPLQNEGTVVGDFTQQEVERMVEALRKGMPPVKPAVQVEVEPSGKSFESTGAEPTSQEQAVIRAVDNKAMLASDLSIELLGVTRVPVRDQPWWKPDRSPLEPMFEWAGFDPSLDPDWEQFDYYAVVMRLTDMPSNKIGWMDWRFSDANGYPISADFYPSPERVSNKYMVAKAARFSKDLETTTLRIGIVSGDWQTLFAGSHYGIYEKGGDSVYVSTPEIGGGPGLVGPSEEGIHIGVTYNITDRDFRVVAVDKEGKVHISSRSGSGGTKNLRRTTASFPNLTREQLQEYRFQVRPYEWMEFKDIPLRPGSEAVALAEQRKARRQEELEKWLGEGQTRQIRQQIAVLRDTYDIHEPDNSQVSGILAMKELVRIGSPTVPELVAELRRCERRLTKSLIAFTLRTIGDRQVVSALIELLGQSKYSGELGIYVKDDRLANFMLDNQYRPPDEGDRKAKAVIIGCPVMEITAALEKITGHNEGHEHFGHKATAELGPDAPHEQWQQRVQQIVQETAGRWQKWWEQHKDEFISR